MIKRENLLLFIGLLVMAVVSIILLMVYQNFVPTSNLDKMYGTKVTLKNTTLINDDDTNIIKNKSDVFSSSGKNLGVVYEVRVFTTDFGDPQLPHLDLYIGINEQNKIFVADIVINQTPDFIPLVKDYILKNYRGIYYENVQFIDGSAGATTIYDSRAAIKGAVTTVIEYHFGEDPLAIFNQTYDTNLNIEIDGGIKYPLTYKGEDFTIYKVSKVGPFTTNQGPQSGSIMVYIAVDGNGIIRHAGLPVELYQHSKSSFYSTVANSLNILVENSVDITSAEFEEFITSVQSGVTGSRTLVNQILDIIGKDYNDENNN